MTDTRYPPDMDFLNDVPAPLKAVARRPRVRGHKPADSYLWDLHTAVQPHLFELPDRPPHRWTPAARPAPMPVDLRTSVKNPIEVEFVPLPLSVPGRLGITFAPGKVGAGATGNVQHVRDIEADLKVLTDSYGVQVLSNCMEAPERARFQIAHLPAAAEAAGLTFIPCPVRDLSVPTGIAQTRMYDAVVKTLTAHLKAGHTVVVTCRGGVGRAGTLATRILIELGLTPGAAVALVRAHRKGAVETYAQEKFLGLSADQMKYGFTARKLKSDPRNGPRKPRGKQTGPALGYDDWNWSDDSDWLR